ncbi:MAG: hypothetical protein PWQ06_2513 [Anaerophaga sp.]|nr:hypothetical protein [Anaerophaga sp.]
MPLKDNKSNSKSIYIFTFSYPFGKGESFLKGEIDYLAEKFDKLYICPKENDKSSARSVPKNAEVICPDDAGNINYKYVFLKNLPILIYIFLTELIFNKNRLKIIGHLSFYIHLITTNLGIEEKIKPHIKKHPDAIFYSFWFYDWATILGILKVKGYIKGFVSRINGIDFEEERHKSGFIFPRIFQLKTVSKVIAVSQYALNRIKNDYPKFHKKYTLSRLGVQDKGKNIITPSSNQIVIVSCAHISPIKRVELIPEILKKTTISIKWVHFGGGNEYQQIIEQKASVLPDNIKYELRGYTPNEEIINYYQTNPVHLFVHLSEAEGGVPVSIQEAISFGIPVLATAVGGVPEIVNDQTGFLLDKNFEIDDAVNFINNFHSSVLNDMKYRNKIKEYFRNHFNDKSNNQQLYNNLISL